MKTPITKNPPYSKATVRRDGEGDILAGDRKDPDDRRVPSATVTLTKVVRERVPVFPTFDGKSTLGAIVDDLLAEAAMEGAEVQSFKLAIDPEYWEALVHDVKRRDSENESEANRRGG